MALPAFILPLIAPITTFIKDWISNSRETRQAKHATSLAIETNKQRIIETKLSNEHALNIERSKSTNPYFKYFTFLMWFGPFILNIFFPKYAQQIFSNIEAAPLWYMESCMTIMFTVWTISVSRDTVQNIFSNLATYMKGRREFKLQRKVVYDMMKVALKRPLAPEEITTLAPILTFIESEANKERG